jgi:hypothetical protein
MEDTSLMNPHHLKGEIKDVEELIVEKREERLDLLERRKKFFAIVSETHDNGRDTTLTHAQVADLIQTLAAYDQVAYRYVRLYEFDLKVYRALTKDRRWFIGSRLRFLK